MLMHESDGQFRHIQVTAYGEHLQQIVGENNKLTPDLLLKSARMESVTCTIVQTENPSESVPTEYCPLQVLTVGRV